MPSSCVGPLSFQLDTPTISPLVLSTEIRYSELEQTHYNGSSLVPGPQPPSWTSFTLHIFVTTVFLCGLQASPTLPYFRADKMLPNGSKLLSRPEISCFSSGTESQDCVSLTHSHCNLSRGPSLQGTSSPHSASVSCLYPCNGFSACVLPAPST